MSRLMLRSMIFTSRQTQPVCGVDVTSMKERPLFLDASSLRLAAERETGANLPWKSVNADARLEICRSNDGKHGSER